MADNRGRGEKASDEASDRAGSSPRAQRDHSFDEERNGASVPYTGSNRFFEGKGEGGQDRGASMGYQIEPQSQAFDGIGDGRFQESDAELDRHAGRGEPQYSFRYGAESLSFPASLDGESLGIPQSETVVYPQRHKVPLPKPSLRAELGENLEQVTALLRIPREPFKEFKGKRFKSQVYLGLSYVFPIINWLGHYQKKDLVGDILAGLAVWSLIPEDLGYALLANLPASYGLLSSFLPPLAYAILGTSRHLAVGPTPLISLLVGSLSSRFYSPSSEKEQYIALVTAATMTSGLFCAALGVLRLGFVADLLSHAAILGFLAGASILSILIEFVNILGYG